MPRRPDACCTCARRFDVGDRIRACLSESESGYERRDYCETCPAPAEPPVIGTWLTRRPEPNARRTTVFDRTAVFELFRALTSAERSEHVQLRFVLALLLWRRKALTLDATLHDEAGEFWRFVTRVSAAAAAAAGTPAAVPETFDVRRPPLDEQQVEALSEQVDRLIAGEPLEIELPPTGEPDAEFAREV